MQLPTSYSDTSLALTPAAEAGVDQLWKFQLRKENAVLLEQLTANEKLIRDLATENNRRCEESLERIMVLEGKLLEFAAAEKKEQDLHKIRTREVEALKAQMRMLRENATANAKLLTELNGQTMVDNSSNNHGDGNNGHSTGINSARVMATNDGYPATKLSNPNLASGNSVSKTGSIKPPSTSRLSINNQSAYYRQPTTRSQRRSIEQATQIEQPRPVPIVQPQAVPAKKAANSPFKLRQGEGLFQKYLENANHLYHSLPKEDKPSDVEFVALFIKGMRDSRQRERLSTQLQLVHPSRTRKDLSVEVICEWEDVLETLKGMGRVVGGASVMGKEGTTRRRKRNILVPRDLMDGN